MPRRAAAPQAGGSHGHLGAHGVERQRRLVRRSGAAGAERKHTNSLHLHRSHLDGLTLFPRPLSVIPSHSSRKKEKDGKAGSCFLFLTIVEGKETKGSGPFQLANGLRPKTFVARLEKSGTPACCSGVATRARRSGPGHAPAAS